MGVGAHQGVGIRYQFAVHVFHSGDGSQVFQVDLVDNSGARRHCTEVIKGGLSPAEKPVTLSIALKLHLGVVFLRFL
ncbi:hypothetical protein D3C75_1165890 [compost metagenome]